MARTREPQPIPRNAVQQIYDVVAHSTTPLTLSEIGSQCPSYSPEQIHWACGTLVHQGIFKPQVLIRSDRQAANPSFKAILPFEENYVGWEQAK